MPVVILSALSFSFGLMLGDLRGLEGGSLTAAVLGAPLAVVGGFVVWRRSQRSAAFATMQGRHACCGPVVTLDRFDEATVTLACVDD